MARADARCPCKPIGLTTANVGVSHFGETILVSGYLKNPGFGDNLAIGVVEQTLDQIASCGYAEKIFFQNRPQIKQLVFLQRPRTS